MTKEVVPSLKGGAGIANGALHDVLVELQGLSFTVVDGAAANTSMVLAGIAADDTIVAAVMFAAGVPSIIPMTVFSAGNVRSTTVTTGNKVLVAWLNKV